MIVYWFYKWNCIPLSPSIWPQILQYQTDKDTFKDNWLLCNLIRIKFLSNFRPIGMAILLTGLREACMIPGCTIRFHLFDSANTIIKYHYNWNNSKQILLQIQWLIEVWLWPSSFFNWFLLIREKYTIIKLLFIKLLFIKLLFIKLLFIPSHLMLTLSCLLFHYQWCYITSLF